jgi:Tfp pilus assembly protein PilO
VKTLPKPLLLAMIVGAGLLLAAGGWLLVVHPQQKKAADLHKQTAAVSQKIADELAQAARAKSAVTTPQIRVADVYKLAKAMPSLADMPDVVLELNQTARAAGVQLLSITPTIPVPGGTGYSTIGLSLSVNGDFYTVTDLVYRLRNLVYVRNGALEANGRLFSIGNVAITPGGKNGRQLSANIAVNTYMYSPATLSTLPGAVPATTSTTTTATTTTTPSSGPSAAGAP